MLYAEGNVMPKIKDNLVINDVKFEKHALFLNLDTKNFDKLYFVLKKRIAKKLERNIEDLTITKIFYNTYANVYHIDFEDKSGKGVIQCYNNKGEPTCLCSNNSMSFSWDLIEYFIEELMEENNDN